MREILFRGKWLNNDAWVSGNLFVSDTDGRTYILAGSRTVTIECEIDPSTVGQYTGLKDKNGKRIFEGDILKWDSREWGCDHLDIVNWNYELFNMRRTDWKEWCEVIGNIHDNLELIKEEAQQ